MNAKQIYLAWVRTNFPQVYSQAMRAVLAPDTTLAGLADDLTASITPGFQDVTVDTSAQSIDPAVEASISQAAADATSDGSTSWTDIFNGITNAISSISSTVVQSKAQQNLLQINTQRAQQGLPPLTANGVPVSASMLAPASTTLAKLESSLGGGGGMLVLGALGLGLLLLLGKRGRA